MTEFAFQKFEEENDFCLQLGDPKLAAEDLAQKAQLASEEQQQNEDEYNAFRDDCNII